MRGLRRGVIKGHVAEDEPSPGGADAPEERLLVLHVAAVTADVGADERIGTARLEVGEDGIDVGLKAFAALSSGKFIDNPRFFRRDEKALANRVRLPP